MNASALPITPQHDLSDAYVAALRAYLQGAGEHALQTGYALGRRALESGAGLLALAQVHHHALATFLQTPSAVERELAVRAAAEFFAECISPYEMTYSAFRETNKVLRHFNDALEQEARRIAHALHDEAGQLLMAVYISLENLAQEVPTARSHVTNTVELLDQIETQLRRLSHELTPALLNDLGLAPALHYLAEGLSRRGKTNISVDIRFNERLPSAVEAALYRVIQESFSNALRHGSATQISVGIQREAADVLCTVRDNGVGFDQAVVAARGGEHGFGLPGMRERVQAVGGELRIHSTPGHGTELIASIPLEP